MEEILSTLGQALVLGWKLIKYIFSKVWKFVLVLVSLILGFFTFKKVKEQKEE